MTMTESSLINDLFGEVKSLHHLQFEEVKSLHHFQFRTLKGVLLPRECYSQVIRIQFEKTINGIKIFKQPSLKKLDIQLQKFEMMKFVLRTLSEIQSPNKFLEHQYVDIFSYRVIRKIHLYCLFYFQLHLLTAITVFFIVLIWLVLMIKLLGAVHKRCHQSSGRGFAKR